MSINQKHERDASVGNLQGLKDEAMKEFRRLRAERVSNPSVRQALLAHCH